MHGELETERSRGKKENAERVRSETADFVTDEAKKYTYEQRAQTARETASDIQTWRSEHKEKKKAFRECAMAHLVIIPWLT